MARKMTPAQTRVLDQIRTGSLPTDTRPLQIASTGESVLGGVVMCHRTVLTDDPLVGRTELFRIQPDGELSQH